MQKETSFKHSKDKTCLSYGGPTVFFFQNWNISFCEVGWEPAQMDEGQCSQSIQQFKAKLEEIVSHKSNAFSTMRQDF